VREPGGHGVEHGGYVRAAVQGQAGVALHALAPRAAGESIGVEVDQVDLTMGGQERF
jgi:hypothetical protein